MLAAALVGVAVGRCCSYDVLLGRRDDLAAAVAARPWQTAAMFVLVYAVGVSLFLPTAAVLAMIAGALFGVSLDGNGDG